MKKIKGFWLGFRNSFYETFLNGRSFAFWGLLTLFLNFILLHGQSFGSDLGYWRAWIADLQQGIGHFGGDYPPLYVLWLKVVATFYSMSELSLKLEYELKEFCEVPVILAHISLVHFVWLRLRNRSWSVEFKTIAMLLVVANPAIYLDGPVWGQVDVLPVTICVWALWYASRPKTYAIGMGLFMLGLLTKFQMVMFLPVFGALSLRYRRIIWKGLLSSIAVFGIVFLPFIVAGNFTKEFSQAYMNTLGSYPFAAMNAGNLWMALVGNMTPDSRVLIEGAPSFLNPGFLGKIVFVLISLAVLVVTFLKRLSVGKIMQMAALNAFAFFMFLPCMHERYSLAAAVVAVASVPCVKRPQFIWAIMLSAVAFLNISMIMALRGVDLWFWISLAGIAAMLVYALYILLPTKYEKALCLIKKLPVPGIVPYALMVIVYAVDVVSTFAAMSESSYVLKEKEVFVYDLPLVSGTQGYGQTNIGKSVDGNPLHINGLLYVAGIGTHAPSRHVYRLPSNAKRFVVTCGVDDETGNGDVEFIIKLDEREIWRSGRMEGSKKATADLDISGGRKLILITDELGSNSYDHADWVNPIVVTE
ncbi:MAG: NPCBM/NEW2 domain-containing protein [Fibrobacter sp.]|nr:NPCBM/NEW2 domain-containing protein [Fibrobacter sp.]